MAQHHEDLPVLFTGARVLLVIACLVVVIAGLQAASQLILPFLVAAFLAILSLPLLSLLQRLRLPNFLAVFLTLAAVVLVLVGIGFLVGGSVQGFTDAAPRYRARLQDLSNSIVAWLQTRGVDAQEMIDFQQLDPGVVVDFIGGTLRAIAAVLSNTVLVLLTMVFILAEAAGFPAKFRAALGHAGDLGHPSRFGKIKAEVQRYLAIKTLISLTTGTLVTIFLTFVGVDFPVLWGLLAFLLNYIPNLGSILAAIPPVLLAILQPGLGLTWALVIAAGYATVNVTLGNLLEPQLMGRRLGLSPLIVFLSLVFWGWVWGPVGMLLSVPLTMIVKIMLENTDDFRWLAIMLDAKPPEPSRKSARSKKAIAPEAIQSASDSKA